MSQLLTNPISVSDKNEAEDSNSGAAYRRAIEADPSGVERGRHH